MDKPIKNCAIINDFSGYGRCSISVALPILSAMGIQCCGIPTAILSNHTGYPDYFFESYTDKMPEYISKLKALDLTFDSIYSGFLGCEEQIDIVEKFISDFKCKSSAVIIDPVMADNGKVYSTCSNTLCEKMRNLIKSADVITPNITEACILADTDYCGESPDEATAKKLCEKLYNKGDCSVLITGIRHKDKISTLLFDKVSGRFFSAENILTEKTYPGTGDVFSSVLTGAITCGFDISKSAKIASDFVANAVAYTAKFDTDINDGIIFEPFIQSLVSLKTEL